MSSLLFGTAAAPWEELASAKRLLRLGDAFVAPRLPTQRVAARQAGDTLLDQFHPRREDYL